MNLYNFWYVDNLNSNAGEQKAYWRSTLVSDEEVREEIQQQHEWTVVFIECIK